MNIHELGDKLHGLAFAAVIAGAFAITSAYAGPLQQAAFPGTCIGGYYCGGFASFLRAPFTQPVRLSAVQFPVIAIPSTPVGRVYVDLYANGQRILQGLDVTGYDHFVSVSLPLVDAWDLTIVPTTFDQIQVGTVTVTFELCAPSPGAPIYTYPAGGTYPYPGTVAPSNPTALGGQSIHCASTPGQTAQCATGLTHVTNVQIAGAPSANPTTSDSCQYGANWGISGNLLWVSNGCEADFIVQGN